MCSVVSESQVSDIPHARFHFSQQEIQLWQHNVYESIKLHKQMNPSRSMLQWFVSAKLKGDGRDRYILITDTGLDIVYGPHGELCACYHNDLPMSDAQTDVSDLDFLSFWLNEEKSVSSASDVLVGTCDVGSRGHFLGLVVRLSHQTCDPKFLLSKS